jgi:ubiquinone/menaquinone biosynthesis C-methylase UbiE
MPDSFASVKQVFEQRSMYDTIVEADYMHHAELVATLSAWAQQQTQPLRIVDVGCGDSWVATHAFRDTEVAEYHGIDISEASIDDARKRITIWSDRATVVAGNLAKFLHGRPSESADVILASYSLHHFLTDAKIALIAECRRVLAPGGTLIWIDAVRNDNESRDAYIDRLTHTTQHNWTALTEDERTRACTHVRESDFPETAAWMRQHIEAAGFKQIRTILSHDFFRGWAFTKTEQSA